jgi:hypothetical protein
MGVSFWMVRTCVRVLQKRGCNDVSAMMCGDGEGDVDGGVPHRMRLPQSQRW